MELDRPRSLDLKVRTLWWGVAVVVAVVIAALAIVAEFLVPTPSGLIAAPGIAAVAAWALWYPAARYRRWSYQLRSHDLVLIHGVVTRVERLVPRTRIQHVDIIGGPIERAMGLRQLAVFTAGTSLADARIPGLTKADADALRAELLSWIEQRRVSGDG